MSQLNKEFSEQDIQRMRNIISGNTGNTTRIQSGYSKNKVTHIEATPTLLEQYEFNKIPSLKRIVSGGEYFSAECYSKLVNSKVKNKCNRRIIN
jgi:hypothetical protein